MPQNANFWKYENLIGRKPLENILMNKRGEVVENCAFLKLAWLIKGKWIFENSLNTSISESNLDRVLFSFSLFGLNVDDTRREEE